MKNQAVPPGSGVRGGGGGGGVQSFWDKDPNKQKKYLATKKRQVLLHNQSWEVECDINNLSCEGSDT